MHTGGVRGVERGNKSVPSLQKFGKNLMDPPSGFSNRVHLCFYHYIFHFLQNQVTGIKLEFELADSDDEMSVDEGGAVGAGFDEVDDEWTTFFVAIDPNRFTEIVLESG